jgi:hypothetical protein
MLRLVFTQVVKELSVLTTLEEGQKLIYLNGVLSLESRVFCQGLRRTLSGDSRVTVRQCLSDGVEKLAEIVASYELSNALRDKDSVQAKEILAHLQSIVALQKDWDKGLSRLESTYPNLAEDFAKLKTESLAKRALVMIKKLEAKPSIFYHRNMDRSFCEAVEVNQK